MASLDIMSQGNKLLYQYKRNVINYFALCSCVVVVVVFDFCMLINHLLQKV